MRLLAGLAASGLVTLAAASSASIFELNGPSNNQKSVPYLSPEETRLLLAQRLGVSRFHKLGLKGPDGSERIKHLQYLSGGTEMFKERAGHVMISIAGVEDPSSIFKSSSPLMFMENAPQSSAVRDLLDDLTGEKEEILNQKRHLLNKAAGSFCITVPEVDLDLPELGEEVREKMTQAFGPQSPEFSEFLLLKTFLQQAAPRIEAERAFGYCHFQALEDVLTKYGSDSPEVELILGEYARLLKSAVLPENTILLLPPNTHSSKGSEIFNHVNKRAEAPLSLLSSSLAGASTPSPPPKANHPKPKKMTSVPRCSSSKKACETATDHCTGGRGVCQKSVFPENCWTCACKPTVVKAGENGIKSTYWAGAACQKKDISIPFNIFLFFGITIFFVMGWAMSLLYSIGSEELPSVLSAGVAPVKKS